MSGFESTRVLFKFQTVTEAASCLVMKDWRLIKAADKEMQETRKSLENIKSTYKACVKKANEAKFKSSLGR